METIIDKDTICSYALINGLSRLKEKNLNDDPKHIMFDEQMHNNISIEEVLNEVCGHGSDDSIIRTDVVAIMDIPHIGELRVMFSLNDIEIYKIKDFIYKWLKPDPEESEQHNNGLYRFKSEYESTPGFNGIDINLSYYDEYKKKK
jgi:hypothetical protein